MALKNFDTDATSVEELLGRFDLLSDNDRQYGALILEKIYGVVFVSDLDRSSWSDTCLDYINFSSKNVNISKPKMAAVFNSLRIIKRFHIL